MEATKKSFPLLYGDVGTYVCVPKIKFVPPLLAAAEELTSPAMTHPLSVEAMAPENSS